MSSKGASTKSDAKPGIDAAAIRELAQLLKDTGLTEIEIERDGMRVRAGRAESSKAQNPPAPATTPIVPSAARSTTSSTLPIFSPEPL